MALNDHFRIIKGQGGPDRLEIHLPNGKIQLVIKEGALTLTPDGGPADENMVEIGSLWFDPVTGRVKIRDASGVGAVVTEPV